MDVVVKWPGSVHMHDTRIFSNCSLSYSLKNGEVARGRNLRHALPDEDPVSVFLLGDPAYPLISYLMQEYSIMAVPASRNSTLARYCASLTCLLNVLSVG